MRIKGLQLTAASRALPNSVVNREAARNILDDLPGRDMRI